MRAEWIWIDPGLYPEYQKNAQFGEACSGADCVVSFRKTLFFERIPEQLILQVSGDAVFRLFINGSFVGQGPAPAGGDFLQKGVLPWYFANKYVLFPESRILDIEAQVRLQPQELTDITGGHGGFYLCGEARFDDGRIERFGTDSGWQARLDRRFVSQYVYNGAEKPGSWQNAFPTLDDRELITAPIPPPDHSVIRPACGEQRRILMKRAQSVEIEFDRIYSAYIAFRCDRPCRLMIESFETAGHRVSREEVALVSAEEYRSFHLKSVGLIKIEVLDADDVVLIEPYLYFSRYPVSAEGHVYTDDEQLDQVYEVCKRTLEICRQSMHLDSPRHQELLACAGDYYIESMMTAFTFGDMRLAALDVERTARWLEFNDGRMFHTNYSLIWVQWIEFVRQYTGDNALVEKCRPGLLRLLRRFDGYIGEKGVVEDPPDYMFVDWVVTDGYSMHHPPKYLGQTVLNAFYYKALTTAAEFARLCGWPEAEAWQGRAAGLKEAFNRCFYDDEAKMYIDGLGDPATGSRWQPENIAARHFSRYSNTLAALYDLCPPTEKARLVRLAADEQSGLPPVQPYFMHFILQAVCGAGLTEEYGLSLFDKWKPMVGECPKGLKEGWIKPEPNYSFDHSHAWGGTPAYHIPLLLTGFRMLEPGFGKIALYPRLFGLNYADVSFPTPYGTIRCVQQKGKRPTITIPNGLKWELSAPDR